MGSYACYAGKEGKTKMEPDRDLEVKLEWAEGGTSSYINVERLSKSTKSDFERAKQAERAERRKHSAARRALTFAFSALSARLDADGLAPLLALLDEGGIGPEKAVDEFLYASAEARWLARVSPRQRDRHRLH